MNRIKTRLLGLSIAAACAFPALALAQSAASDAAAASAAPSDDTAMTAGEVRKIDKANRKITLRHAEIRNLDMPGMTMVFRVTDPALIEGVKPGDHIVFRAEKANGALVVTDLRPAR